jgi:hypothetical protein
LDTWLLENLPAAFDFAPFDFAAFDFESELD